MAEHQSIIIKKVKGHGGHAHHGGSWKVAYADFVTAMMAFFMVMWIMGLSAENKAIIQGYFNDPLGFAKSEPRSKSIIAMPAAASGRPGKSHKGEAAQEIEENSIREVEKELKAALKGSIDIKSLLKDVTVTVTPEGLLIELTEKTGTFFFNSGQATIRPEGHKLIARIAPILKLAGKKMIIEGHTDAEPYGGKGYTNWDLSAERALALRRELSGRGVADGQFAAIRAWADTKLKFPDRPLDPENRRVSILLPRVYKAGDLSALPGDEARTARTDAGAQPLGIRPPPPEVRATAKK